jgi:alginate O-acetyltransferase complex protein AlgJ
VRSAVIQSVLFVAAISLPLCVNVAGRDGGDARAEGRELATIDEGMFAWFDDHFGLRSALVAWNATFEYHALGVSPSPSVVRGQGDWLFYAESDAIEDHVSRNPLGRDEVEAWRQTVIRSRDWLRARGAAYVFTVAPDKHVIYPEKFYPSVHRVGRSLRMDQVLDALADTGVVVDLRPVMAAAKTRERIYHLTDSHWNPRGAHAAYEAIIEAVHTQVPAVPAAWKLSDFEAIERRSEGLDLARMMGLRDILSEVDLALLPRRPRLAKVVDPPGVSATVELGRMVTEIPGSTLPRAVIFRDSFSTALVPFLSEHFGRTVYLWQKDFVPEQVIEEGADVVIYEIASRHLYNFVPTPDLIEVP